jgi:hypothetical protein
LVPEGFVVVVKALANLIEFFILVPKWSKNVLVLFQLVLAVEAFLGQLSDLDLVVLGVEK